MNKAHNVILYVQKNEKEHIYNANHISLSIEIQKFQKVAFVVDFLW